MSAPVLADTLPALAIPWRRRVWPAPAPGPATSATVVRAMAVGLLAALVVRPGVVGAAIPLTAAVALVVALRSTDRRPRPVDLLLLGGSVGVLVTCAWRGAEWLAALSMLLAAVVGSVALVGATTWTGVALGGIAGVLRPRRLLWWTRPGLRRVVVDASAGRSAAVAAVSVVLLVVFGALFAAADPVYADLLDDVTPDLRTDQLVGRVFLFVAVATLVLLAAWLTHDRPVVDALAPAAAPPARRREWVLPLACLDLLFLSFVLVQLTVLFGDRSYVLRTEGLTYAEYARRGFWQLLVVTALTLLVIALAVRRAPRATERDRTVVRVLLGVLCATSLVVVASALHRMSLYQQEYGYTRLRLLVDVVELALGAVFVLLLAAGVRMSGAWLPRAVVGIAVAAVLALVALDPDRWIADRNVDRYQRTGSIDLAYLATLSSDAVPALMRLPIGVRGCALRHLTARLADEPDSWYDGNLSRSRARARLAEQPPGPCLVSR